MEETEPDRQTYLLLSVPVRGIPFGTLLIRTDSTQLDGNSTNPRTGRFAAIYTGGRFTFLLDNARGHRNQPGGSWASGICS